MVDYSNLSARRSLRKNKKYEDIYGSDRASSIKNKISLSSIGKKRSVTTRTNISKALLGRTRTEEHCKNLSKSLKGRVFTDEWIDKLKGRTPWNKGFTKLTDTRIKSSKGSWIKGSLPWNKNGPGPFLGKKHSKYTIEKMKSRSAWNKGLLGELSPRWSGGLSYQQYPIEFNIAFKKSIRKRDNYRCLGCGKYQELGNRSLDIHHINYDKKLTIPENCCAVCRSCNIKVNSNRIHWIGYFQIVLASKYGYKYDNNLSVVSELKNDQ